MRYRTLDEWLRWQETLHPSEIELGLTRVATVWRALVANSELPFRVITVAGTNGKGSTVAFLEAMLLAAGYRVGCFTSPHLVRYNERIRLNGRDAEDAQICAAFARIDQAREETSLTYFEFSALAALLLFHESRLDVVVLEVGLGGRLDATNIVDADLALITTIGLDHTAWLGDTLEAIAAEKAGIMRPQRPAVYAGCELPAAIAQRARQLAAPLYRAGSDYRFEQSSEQRWCWQSVARHYPVLPLPSLRGAYQLRNAAGAIMALELLRQALPVASDALMQGLQHASIKGRFQVLREQPLTVLDVAHNGQAAQQLAANLRQYPRSGQTSAVFGIMGDKDVDAVIESLLGTVDRWHLADLKVPRALPPARLSDRLVEAGVAPQQISIHADAATAWAHASTSVGHRDRLLAFGSFWLIGDLLRLEEQRGDSSATTNKPS